MQSPIPSIMLIPVSTHLLTVDRSELITLCSVLASVLKEVSNTRSLETRGAQTGAIMAS